MSEYQYYEFQAIDRPLTAEEQAYVRTLSRRVEPTPTRAVFTYSYGDFRGNPLTLLETCFDAMLYVANWGSTRLAFRFPRAAIDLDRLTPYAAAFDEITLTATERHVVLDVSFNDEDGTGWIEGEGILSTLTPLRHDILRGDLRAPYLAWLRAAQYADDPDDSDDGLDENEASVGDGPARPAAPAGLGQLSAPLRAFVEFFEIAEASIAAAAADSPSPEGADDQIERWVTMLPEAERGAWLVRLARGEPHLDAQLLRRLREVGATAR